MAERYTAEQHHCGLSPTPSTRKSRWTWAEWNRASPETPAGPGPFKCAESRGSAPLAARGFALSETEINRPATVKWNGQEEKIGHGAVVIASITSCTNTSNPSVMLAAGLLAKKAVEKGLKTPRHVKTSLAPGSRVVTDYLEAAGLNRPLDALGFATVGGCMTASETAIHPNRLPERSPKGTGGPC